MKIQLLITLGLLVMASQGLADGEVDEREGESEAEEEQEGERESEIEPASTRLSDRLKIDDFSLKIDPIGDGKEFDPSRFEDESGLELHRYNTSGFESWEEVRDVELRAEPRVLLDSDEEEGSRNLGACTSFESSPKHPGGSAIPVFKPWGPKKRKTCKIFMTWADGSSGVCSASLVGPFHLLTAAHCTLDGCGQGFATRILVKCGYGHYWGARDYAHLGTAYVRSCVHYTSFVKQQSCMNGRSRGPFKWDIQLCRLDRSLSHSHGYMGYTTAKYGKLNVRGYVGNPQLNAFIPAATHKQFWRYTTSLAMNSKQYRMPLAWIFGGESGCPYYAYKAATNQRWVNAVHNGGPTSCYEIGRRVDKNFFKVIKDRRASWTSDTHWCNPIEDYANVAGHHAYPWKGVRKLGGMYTTSIQVIKGAKFDTKFPMINVGPKATGNFVVRYFATNFGFSTYLGSTIVSIGGWSTKMVFRSGLSTAGLAHKKLYRIIAKWYPACKPSADPRQVDIGYVYVKKFFVFTIAPSLKIPTINPTHTIPPIKGPIGTVG